MSLIPLQPRFSNFSRSPKNMRTEFIRNALTQLNTLSCLEMSFTSTFKSLKAQTTN